MGEVFHSLYGNAVAFGQLHSYVGRKDLPNSIILRGPEGVGKFTACLEFARQANCKADRTKGCRCESCLKILQGISPNRLAFNSKVSPVELRELQSKLGMKVSGGHRFVIVRAELLDSAAQDMFLKTLEEPAEKTTFLITSSRSNLNRTVISRSFTINFTLCNTDDMVEFVTKDKMAQRLLSSFAREDVALLMVLSAGAPGVLLRLMGDPTVKVKLAMVRSFFAQEGKAEFFKQLSGSSSKESEDPQTAGGAEELAWMVRCVAMARVQGIEVVNVSLEWAKYVVDGLTGRKFYPVQWRLMDLYMKGHP